MISAEKLLLKDCYMKCVTLLRTSTGRHRTPVAQFFGWTLPEGVQNTAFLASSVSLAFDQ